MDTVDLTILPDTGIAKTVAERRGAVLTATGLAKSFGGQTVLRDVSVELRRGEVVLLRGPNGSGKTTLLNILTGNLEADAGNIQLAANGRTEHFRFPKRWWHDLNPFDHFLPERIATAGVGRTWQDIRLFPTQSLIDNIAVASTGQIGENPAWALLRRRAIRRQEQSIQREAVAMLGGLGLEGRDASSGDRVSLGQSKRVAIARAVRAGARIVFLDEPLAGLDNAGIDTVMKMLERLAREEDITLVIVEHVFNIPRVLDLADTVWTLEGGRLNVEVPDSVREEIETTSHPGIEAWIRRLAGETGYLEEVPLSSNALLTLITPEGLVPGDVILELENVVVHRGNRIVIGTRGADGTDEGISFSLCRNQLALLQAPNGWGKTTLLEAVAGVLPVSRGIIRLQGREIQNIPPWKRDISLLQARDQSFPSLGVKEVLQLAGVNRVGSQVQPLLNKQVSELSGGEKQKLALASALNRERASLFLLDEPFSALDAFAMRQLLDSRNMFYGVPAVIAIPYQ